MFQAPSQWIRRLADGATMRYAIPEEAIRCTEF
jgi:hypothetical protein